MANAPFHLLFQLLLLFPIFAFSQSNNGGRVTVGTSISASDSSTPWLSPSGDFAFGFQKPQENGQFLLSIWYNKIPDKTIVWYGNDGNFVSSGSKVVLTADLGLVLSDSQGKQIWKSDPISGTVSVGIFNDTGNFMLVGSDSSNLWDSFSHPTDTLLPTQIMETGGVIYSKRSETNFNKGRFQLSFLENGNLVLNTRDLLPDNSNPVYETWGAGDPTSSNNSGYQLKFNETGYLYVMRSDGAKLNLAPGSVGVPPSSGYYHRAILHFDGVFVQYYHPKVFTGTPNWSVVWQKPDDICNTVIDMGSGVCGFNSICRLLDSRRPICECPQGYTLLDPVDTYGSCKPNFSLSCDDDYGNSSAEELYTFVELSNTNFPTGDYEHMQSISEFDCRNSCLHDCFCAALVFGRTCWKKKLPLSNGRKDMSSAMGKTLLKFRKGDILPQSPRGYPPLPHKKKDQRTLIIVESVLLGGSIIVNIILIGAGCLGSFGIYQWNTRNTLSSNNNLETNLHSFTYKELEEATNGFKEELGRGSFGIVYKGIIQMSSTITVAVKKLDRLFHDCEKEFKTEVNVIGQTHHKNLVRLLGFSEDGEHRLLVYECMANGTLADFVFGDVKPSWAQRCHIALGIARGLAYLHEECSTQIIHCDIKPQNILLDEYYNARISDFGLAKLLMINQSKTNTGIRGTKGYVAPDWFKNTPVTTKVDVYSFGVMLLEMIFCRRSVEDMDYEGEKDILMDQVWDCFQDGRLHELVEHEREVVLNDWKELVKFVKVGIWCIQEDPSLRPSMRKVIQMLEGVVDVPTPPCPSS